MTGIWIIVAEWHLIVLQRIQLATIEHSPRVVQVGMHCKLYA